MGAPADPMGFNVRTGFGAMTEADLPGPHRRCPPLDEVTSSRLTVRCTHKNKTPRVVAAIHGGHLVHRYGCTTYPGAAHEEVELICDKCGRAWTVRMSRLREVIEDSGKRKIVVADLSRRSTFLGGPSSRSLRSTSRTR